MERRYTILLMCLWCMGLSSGCGDESHTNNNGSPDRGIVYTEQREPCSAFNPFRNPYFGDLHFHSVLSHDVWIFDGRSTPEEGYRFARGAPITVPPLDENGHGTQTLQLERPLDFAALADHSEFLAEVEACLSPDSGAYDSLTCVIYRMANFLSTIVISYQLSFPEPTRSPDICGPGGVNCPEVAARVWKRIQDAAEQAYDRTSECAFTSFVSYEYTATTIAANLHRNVFFRNANVPDLPISYFEQPTPQGLWGELNHACLEGMSNCDVIVIPHNSDESNGNKFFVNYPGAGSIEEERQAAALRAQMEPLVEIFQNKGDSECMNGLSGVPGDPDPLCDFEKIRKPPFDDCGEGTGFGGTLWTGCVSRLDYVRNVLLAGLQEEERLGVNPYKLGIMASTDTHDSSPGAVLEDRYAGHLGKVDATPEARLNPSGFGGNQGYLANPAGLTAVWAKENSRDAIFEAFHRRESYGTSGPRIVVRFFGSWDFPGTMCGDQDFAQVGYQEGIPMGGDLPPRPQGSTAPRFAVLALREQDFGQRHGTPLQRIQIIKGWIDCCNQRPMLKVFEVAGDPDNGAGVDLETCERTGTGSDRLCAVWTDPEFNPSERAFYYARVVENPTCRWSTYDCNSLPPEERPTTCSDPTIPKVIQERAWTSPIWYQPDEEAGTIQP